jgi:hypothetical protein
LPLYDPVYSQGFHRSRSGRVMARFILALNVALIGWLLTQSVWGLLWGLVLVPLFIRWKRGI